MIQKDHQQREETLNIRQTGDKLYRYILCDRRVALTTSLETLPHDTHALVLCYEMAGTVVIHGELRTHSTTT